MEYYLAIKKNKVLAPAATDAAGGHRVREGPDAGGHSLASAHAGLEGDLVEGQVQWWLAEAGGDGDRRPRTQSHS